MRKAFNIDDYARLDFDEIDGKIEELLTASYNLMDRNWPGSYSENLYTQDILMSFAKMNHDVYRGIRLLLRDAKNNIPDGLMLATITGPLIRSIVDIVFNIVFLFDDLDKNIKWFIRSGWRNFFNEYKNLLDRYKGDEKADQSLAQKKKALELMEKHFNIPPEDKKKNKPECGWWPNPGKMRRIIKSQNEKKYLEYLNKFYYGELSSCSHGSLMGTMYRSGYNAIENVEVRDEMLMKTSSDNLFRTCAFILAFISEIECQIRLGLDVQKIKYAWTYIAGGTLEAKEIYEMRYQDWLDGDIE